MPSESGKQPYDSHATGYAKCLDPTLTMAAERLAEMAGARPGMRVLDVATGTGTAARAAARRGASVVGIDRSPGMLSVARKLSPEVNLTLGTSVRFPAQTAPSTRSPAVCPCLTSPTVTRRCKRFSASYVRVDVSSPQPGARAAAFRPAWSMGCSTTTALRA